MLSFSHWLLDLQGRLDLKRSFLEHGLILGLHLDVFNDQQELRRLFNDLVNFFVLGQVGARVEVLEANIALVGLFASVDAFVPDQVAGLNQSEHDYLPAKTLCYRPRTRRASLCRGCARASRGTSTE